MRNILFIFLSGLIILFACSEGNIISDYDIVFPEEDVSYLYHVQPFLKSNCAFAGCHGNTAAANINMSDYFTMMQVPGLVIPKNPGGSQLIQVLDETMPHSTRIYRGNITDNQIEGMKTWVEEGALNN